MFSDYIKEHLKSHTPFSLAEELETVFMVGFEVALEQIDNYLGEK